MTTIVLYGDAGTGTTRLANRIIRDFELEGSVNEWVPWGSLQTGHLHITNLDVDHLGHLFGRRDDALQPVLIFEISALKTLLGFQQ